jgi:hypothetical protein
VLREQREQTLAHGADLAHGCLRGGL